MSWARRTQPIKVGDTVAYSRHFLQSIACYTGDMPRAGGTVTALVPVGKEVTLADVYAALAYYCDHREEIEADIRADKQFVADLFAHAPPSLLRQRLGMPDTTGHPLPPR